MTFDKVYFVGIGGIGMSAIARYFKHEGKMVAGYDRTSTPLTENLQKEGIEVHFEDDLSLIDERFKDPESTLVVYTPAIPADHSELTYFMNNGFNVVKRSKILGVLSQHKYLMAVAGTHGKTTTTTMLAYFNSVAGGGGSAFLGGISKNFSSNLVLGKGDRLAVEADEFDRSFLQLSPSVAVITSVDADHLDIYGDHDTFKQAFLDFIDRIRRQGTLVIKNTAAIEIKRNDIKIYKYSLDDQQSDFYAKNLTVSEGGYYTFDIVFPDRVVEKLTLGIPGLVNVENCIAASSLLWQAGFDEDKFREAVATFKGIERRMDVYLNTTKKVYIDDYAHHPEELRATITSLRSMYPKRKITAIFQPHLYTRTRDFYTEFARSLSMVDHLILLPIYPARELPIEGVTSEIIRKNVTCQCEIVEKKDLLGYLENTDIDVLVTFGAGDISDFCKGIAEIVKLQA